MSGELQKPHRAIADGALICEDKPWQRFPLGQRVIFKGGLLTAGRVIKVIEVHDRYIYDVLWENSLIGRGYFNNDLDFQFHVEHPLTKEEIAQIIEDEL